MKREIMRQFVHLSGLGFVYLSQFFDKYFSATYFLIIAISFLIYSWYVTKQMNKTEKLMDILEDKFRKVVMTFDRENLPRPFMGPFWFYFGFFLAYLLFPIEIAMASCAILAVGDAFSTLVGKSIGRIEYLHGKTLEGSVAFFVSSFLVAMLMVSPTLAFTGALVGALVEPLPSLKHLKRLYRSDLIDDNLLIPLLVGLAMLLL